MIPAIGHFSLALALVVSLIQVFAPKFKVLELSRLCARLAATLCLTSFLCLVISYIVSDFSVLNVIQNSHLDKPLLYKISGAWGNHEGSMLLWVMLLCVVGIFYSRKTSFSLHGGIVALFTAFILFTSNPFTRIFPPTQNGLGLNPLLQHPALAIHPPLLYLGMVGFAVVFVLAIAALINGQSARAWAAKARPWALFSWTALGAGTALGAWWAYAELGWGGWWFWDPVENAALMPWLTGTALIHTLIALEKRGVMARWSYLLAILTFVLCVMGLFLVRGGLLTSVHAFASAPERGLFILGILTIITLGGFSVFAYAQTKDETTSFSMASRESALLAGSAFLFSAFSTVFIGTLYPLVIEALNMPSVSIGPPYFHRTFVPILLPALCLIPVAPFLAWQKGDMKHALTTVAFAGVAALGGGLVALFFISRAPILSAIGVMTGVWIILGGITPLLRQIGIQKGLRGIPLGTWGVSLAHGGAGLVILAAMASHLWQTETIHAADLNQPFSFMNKTVSLEKISEENGQNYHETRATIRVGDMTLSPAKRFYPVREMQTEEAAIHTSAAADWFAHLGQPLGQDRHALRLRYIPMMLWLWLGFILVTIGGIIATIKTIRKKRQTP